MEQHRLAKIAGCSVETIRKIEKGRIKLSDLLATKIALATGVYKGWLMENNLDAPPRNTFYRPYTKRDFETAQAEKMKPLDGDWLCDMAEHAYCSAMQFLSSAEKSGRETAVIAAYKMTSALNELEAEFGTDNSVFPIQMPARNKPRQME